MKQETHAEIIARMRSDAEEDEYTPDGILGQTLHSLADSLEAAHKREVDALKQRCTELNAEVAAKDEVIKRLNDALAEEQRRKMTTAENSSAVGNTAKMREALEQLYEQICYGETEQNVVANMQMIRAALAAPARECDIGTAEEQSRRFCAFCRPRTEPCDGCACLEGSRKGRCEFVWAQLQHESEEVK